MDKTKKTDQRVRLGETLGVPTPDPEGTNLTEMRALYSALIVTRRLNDMSVGPKKRTKGRNSKKRRSSVTLMEATETLFVISSDEEKERDVDGDLNTDLVNMNGSRSSSMSFIGISSEDDEEYGMSETDSRVIKEDRDTPELGDPEEATSVSPDLLLKSLCVKRLRLLPQSTSKPRLIPKDSTSPSWR